MSEQEEKLSALVKAARKMIGLPKVKPEQKPETPSL